MNKNQKIVVAAAAVIFVGLVAYAFVAGSHPASLAPVAVTTRDINQEVKSSGIIQGSGDVELSFQSSGKIVAVNADIGQQVYKGQLIASLDTSMLYAQLSGAEAALKTQQLKLQGLTGASGDTSDVQVGINNSRMNLADKITDGYVKIDTSLSAYVDSLFSNPKTDPHFGTSVTSDGATYTVTTDWQQELAIDDERSQLTNLMNEWSMLNTNLTTDSQVQASSQKGEQVFALTQKLLSDIADALNTDVGQDSKAQGVLASYKAAIANARATVNTGLTNLRAAEQAFATAHSPASTYSVEIQQAAIQSAQAQVDAISASINQAVIRAPFAGVITEQNAKVGQIAAPGMPLVHIISKDKLQVETYVSQADIGKITVGMPASITLDAYGPDKSWNATVVSVAAGESNINGVSGYKVVLQFNDADQQIKSGMGATVHFQISHKSGVVAVPDQAIIRKDNAAYVLVDLGGGKQEQRAIITGISGEGYTEVVSGLSAGDKVVTFTTTK